MGRLPCLAFCSDGDVVLQSRNDRPLTRYFPEVVDGLRRLGDVVLDGELVITRGGRADFPALLARLHPAASRVELLARGTPFVRWRPERTATSCTVEQLR